MRLGSVRGRSPSANGHLEDDDSPPDTGRQEVLRSSAGAGVSPQIERQLSAIPRISADTSTPDNPEVAGLLTAELACSGFLSFFRRSHRMR